MSVAGELVKAAREAWQNRIRVDVTGVFTDVPDIGHTVRIRNIGAKPVVLKNWEIQRGRALRRNHVESLDAISAGDLHDNVIEPMCATTLRFKEAYYFRAGPNLSIRLWFAGRKRPARYSLP